MDSTPFISIVTGSDGNVFVIVRQAATDGRMNEIVLSNVHFSGLMYMFKSIEQQFVADETRKRANKLITTAATIDFQSSYDPCKPEMLQSSYDPCKQEMLTTQCNENTDNIIEKKQEQKKGGTDRVKNKSSIVHNRLLEIYAMFFCERYSAKITERCKGCVSKKFAPSAHNVCKMMKTADRVQLIFDDLMSDVTDEMIIQKLEEGDDDGTLLPSYIVKDTLMNNEKWKQKLKSKICKYI